MIPYSTLLRSKAQSFKLDSSYDLLCLAGLAILAALLQPYHLPLLRIPLGLGLALFGPGYALIALIFPKHSDLDGIARGTLSFVSSFAQLSLLILILNQTGWGFQPWLIVYTLTAWIVLLCGLAILRRGMLEPAALLVGPHLSNPRSWWAQLGRHTRRSLILGTLLATLVFAAGGFSLTMQLNRPMPSEFYILGNEGRAQEYPRAAQLGHAVQLSIGLTNTEPHSNSYRVEVWVSDPWNTGRRERILVEEAIVVQSREQLQKVLRWIMPWAGKDQKVELLLFRSNETTVYRQLVIWLNVSE